MNRLDLGGFSEGFGAELVRGFRPELLDGELDGAGGGGVLEVEGEIDRVDGGGFWFVFWLRFPFGLRFGHRFWQGFDFDFGLFIELPVDLLAPGLQADVVDAAGAGGGDFEVVGLAGDEVFRRGGRLDDVPFAARRSLDGEGGSGEGIEAPAALYGACDGGRGFWQGLGCGGFFCGLEDLWGMVAVDDGFCGSFGWDGELVAGGLGWGDSQPALEGVLNEGDVERSVVGEGGSCWQIEVKHQVLRVGGGEDEGCAVDGEHHAGVEQAGDVVWLGGAQGREDGLLDGGQTDDDDRLGVVEGGRGVEAEIEAGFGGKGDGGNVLVLGGVDGAGQADEIYDGSDIGGVASGSGELGVGGLVDEIGAGAAGECVDDAFAVAIIEQRLGSGLGEAVELLFEGALEAVGVGLQVEGAGEEVGVLGEGGLVSGWDLLHLLEVLFYAGLLESGFDEVLVGADEDAGGAFDGGTEGAVVASGLRGEEEDGLLGFGRDGDGDALFADLFFPGFDAREPVVGRGGLWCRAERRR